MAFIDLQQGILEDFAGHKSVWDKSVLKSDSGFSVIRRGNAQTETQGIYGLPSPLGLSYQALRKMRKALGL